MSFTGTVRGGVIVLPAGVNLPEGSQVDVAPHTLQADDDPFLKAVEQVARPRPHWPEDFPLNHGHYVSGEPKKA